MSLLVRNATPLTAASQERVAWLRAALAPVHVDFMGAARDPLPHATHIKYFEPEAVSCKLTRPSAFHAVEPDQIVAACTQAGREDRIEHASVCPEAVIERVAQAGCMVCANPGFVLERADALVEMAEGAEAAFYQPLWQLLQAGIPVSFGSDAPVGSPGRWHSIAGAVSRNGATRNFPGRGLSLTQALRCASTRRDLVQAGSDSWLGTQADFILLEQTQGSNQIDPSQPPVRGIALAGQTHWS